MSSSNDSANDVSKKLESIEKESLRIEGERLYLRTLLESDVSSEYESWMNDEEVNRYLESRFTAHTQKSLREYVSAVLRSKNEMMFAIVRKDDDRHVGNIKLGPINAVHRYADIGIIIGDKSCWGRGYATEAVEILSEYAFRELSLNKLTAGCYDCNGGSAKAFLKAGFEKEGLRLKQYSCGGEYVDAICLGKVAPRA